MLGGSQESLRCLLSSTACFTLHLRDPSSSTVPDSWAENPSFCPQELPSKGSGYFASEGLGQWVLK